MENLYQIPSESCGGSKRRDFWAKVMMDQSASGVSAKKFCNLHQLKYSTFKGYKYRRQKNKIKRRDINNKPVVNNIQSDNCAARFIPLQIATAIPANEYSKNEPICHEISEIQIVFKNKHKLLLSSTIPEASLLLIIKVVAELKC
jgi:hypothetical protein